MDEVFIFDKSLQQRLEEYLDVFSSDKKRTVFQIQKEWSFFMEFAVDPNGWQAVWKIPRLKCEELSIPFPTIVLVFVEHVFFESQAASVKIIAVQDELLLPEEHFVSLKQLWPTKDQDKTVVLNIESTANTIDSYRFFYTNIMFPWDFDDDEESDWMNKHLESRLRLYFQMKNGVIPRNTAEHIKDLLTEAKKLQAKREQIESSLGESEIDEDYSTNESIQELMGLNVNLLQIKNEIHLLENPLTRDVIIKRQKEVQPKKDAFKPQFWVIYAEGKIDEYITFLNHIKITYPNETFKFASNLTSILDLITSKDTIILSKTNHIVRAISELENGGHIKGIFDKEETTLTSFNEDIMLDFKGESYLESLTINATFPQCGILIRAGKTTLKNCKLIGSDTSSIHQGIIVLGGAKLELIDCEITGFCTAIVGNSGAEINLQNTSISQTNIGIRIYDKCYFKATDCALNNCKEFGLCLETENNMNESHKIGSFDVLNVIPDICIKDTVGKNNMKGDVLINRKPKIVAIHDLFSNPLLDPTRKKDSQSTEDEDMEGNVTVIERKMGDAE